MGTYYYLKSEETMNYISLGKGWGEFDTKKYNSLPTLHEKIKYIQKERGLTNKESMVVAQAFEMVGNKIEIYDDSIHFLEDPCAIKNFLIKVASIYNLINEIPERDFDVGWVSCKKCEENIFDRSHAPPYNCKGKKIGFPFLAKSKILYSEN